MSADRSGKFHVKVWIFTILATTLLYVLAFPPLWFWFGWMPYYTSHRPHPEWLGLYRDSYSWIGEHTHLKKPLDGYLDWCIERMRDARGIRMTPQDPSL